MAGYVTRDELKYLADRLHDLEMNAYGKFPRVQYRLLNLATDLDGLVYALTKDDVSLLEWGDPEPTMEAD